MKKLFNNIKTYKHSYIKGTSLIITSSLLVLISIYSKEYKNLNIIYQISIIIIIISLNTVVGLYFDEIKLKIEKMLLEKEVYKLNEEVKNVKKAKSKELEELKSVIVRFLEYSEIYRKKIISYLNLDEEYLCIGKSSEGLSEIYKAINPKPMLPFSKVLHDWPGSIKPFENMNLYLIPIKNFKNFDYRKTRKWIKSNIIPKVKNEREILLQSIPRKISKLADDFSFKYIAIVIRKNSIEYDSENRKFNNKFISTFIYSQDSKKITKMTSDLTDVISAKDFFLLIDWSSFANLNNEQKKLVKKHRDSLYKELSNINVNNLIDLSNISVELLSVIFKKIFRKKISNIKSINISKKIIDGTNNVLSILRKAGVNI